MTGRQRRGKNKRTLKQTDCAGIFILLEKPAKNQFSTAHREAVPKSVPTKNHLSIDGETPGIFSQLVNWTNTA
jgi:hypothetical protein